MHLSLVLLLVLASLTDARSSFYRRHSNPAFIQASHYRISPLTGVRIALPSKLINLISTDFVELLLVSSRTIGLASARDRCLDSLQYRYLSREPWRLHGRCCATGVSLQSRSIEHEQLGTDNRRSRRSIRCSRSESKSYTRVHRRFCSVTLARLWFPNGSDECHFFSESIGSYHSVQLHCRLFTSERSECSRWVHSKLHQTTDTNGFLLYGGNQQLSQCETRSGAWFTVRWRWMLHSIICLDRYKMIRWRRVNWTSRNRPTMISFCNNWESYGPTTGNSKRFGSMAGESFDSCHHTDDGAPMSSSYTAELHDSIAALVSELQPHANIFGGYTVTRNPVRWIGNELGHAPDPTWSTGLDNGGDPDSPIFIPAECDTTLQQFDRWFWVRDKSVGRMEYTSIVFLGSARLASHSFRTHRCLSSFSRSQLRVTARPHSRSKWSDSSGLRITLQGTRRFHSCVLRHFSDTSFSKLVGWWPRTYSNIRCAGDCWSFGASRRSDARSSDSGIYHRRATRRFS